MMIRQIIITGATGLIGHALLDECINRNIKVFAICRADSPRLAMIPDNPLVQVVLSDLSGLLSIADKLPDSCDAFYHLGWLGTAGIQRNDMELQIKNIRYTMDAIELAHRCGCISFIGAGSQAEYGRFEGNLTPDTPAFPENGYGMAKLCAGQMSRVKARQYGMKHIWPRILSVYGPGDSKQTMIMSTIYKLLKHEMPYLTKGEQLWDYLYVKDAARIMLSLAENGKDGKVYCVGSGQARPLKEYIELIRNSIDPSLPLGLGKIAYGPQQVMHLCADISDIVADLHYHPQYSFPKGIRETIDWCKTHV